MLYFYSHEHCKECEEIQSRLRDLVLAHRVIGPGQTVEGGPPLPSTLTPPALIDGNSIVSGAEAIALYLEELHNFKESWDKFQGDSCYCGDDGEIE